MKLRDYYESLASLCDDLGIEPEQIERPLNDAGFSYDSANNRFS